MRRTLLVALTLTIASTEVAAAELTIRDEHEPASRRHQLDVGLQGYVGYRPGAVPFILYGFPVAPRGFITALNDCFFIEAGVFPGVFFDPTLFWLTPALGVRWSFYLTKEWAVFAAFRGGWSFVFDDDIVDPVDGIYIDGTVGAHWHFSQDFALRLEVAGTRHGGRGMVGISWQMPVTF